MVKISIEDGVKIRGDFFIEPPQKLKKLENVLEEFGASAQKQEIVSELEQVDARLIGFSREDIAELYRELGEEK